MALLVGWEALSTGQLRRLTGSSERTVQYQLARLASRGLVGRYRPIVARGTSPALWWATPFGARAVATAGPGAETDGVTGFIGPDAGGLGSGPDRGVRRVSAVVALNGLRLALAAAGPAVGVRLRSWQRTPGGVRVDGVRRLGIDARFTVDTATDPAGADRAAAPVEVLVYLDSGQLPRTRLAGPLAVFARLVASAPGPPGERPCAWPWLLVLTGQRGRVGGWLAAAEELIARPPAGLDPQAARAAAGRVAVCACPPPGTDILDRLWQRPGTSLLTRLGDLLRTPLHPAGSWPGDESGGAR